MPAGREGEPDRSRCISEAARLADIKVVPHWSEEGDSFWYRREIANGRFEFIFVDSANSTRRSAFDHQRLAKELSRHIDHDAASPLPFQYIDVLDGGSVVRFQIGGKNWRFSSEAGLTPSAEQVSGGNLHPITNDAVSADGGCETSIVFENNTEETISYYWVDFTGDSQRYGEIKPGQTKIQHTYEGHVWLLKTSKGDSRGLYSASNEQAKIVIEPSEESCSLESSKVLEANGKPEVHKGVFVRDHNIWYRESDGTEIQISQDGSSSKPYDTIHASPDGVFAVIYQSSKAQEHTVHMVESSPDDQLQPKLKSIQYLKPGDRVKIDRPHLFDLVKKVEVATSDGLFNNPYGIDDMQWDKDGLEYRFLYNERGHRRLRIIGMNRDGQVRTILEEISSTFIDYSQKLYWMYLDKQPGLIWASERDGHNHLFMFDASTGNLINQITSGSFVVHCVDRIDESKQQIWIKVYGLFPTEDPYYQHLVRVNFDGTGFTCLTEGNGTHTWAWSPNYQWLIDSWSRVDLAPKTVLRNASNGDQLIVLEEGDLQALLETGWSPPERFEAPGRDGRTPTHGIIIKPLEFDQSRQYRVIENIYAGPQDFHTPKRFSLLKEQHELADEGFVIVQLDGMGTNWRSKAFHNVCFKNLKDAGFPDRIEWIRAAAKSRPWMDISQVGIYGTSAGGQSAMGALLFHGEFYKVAVADSGCHDNRMDKIWWNEQWMGWPVDESYEDSSNVVHASKLNGALMLMVGELDTNVDPSSTFQVLNALNKAEKDYELVFFPGGEHGVGIQSSYGKRRLRNFFKRNLLITDGKYLVLQTLV